MRAPFAHGLRERKRESAHVHKRLCVCVCVSVCVLKGNRDPNAEIARTFTRRHRCASVPPASRPAGAAPRHQRGRVACGAAARGGGGAGTLSSRTRHLKTTSGTASPALTGVEPPRSTMARLGIPAMSAPAGTRPAKEPLPPSSQEPRATRQDHKNTPRACRPRTSHRDRGRGVCAW